jgi:hypothetical protein
VGEPPPGSPREEAERLVAAAVVTASLATRGWLARVGHGAADAAECGVCPFCRAVAAVRDPDPVLVERLARGAGDVAEGVSGVLRAVGDLLRPAEPAGGPEPDRGPQSESGIPRQAPQPSHADVDAGVPGGDRTPLVTDNLDTAS